MSPQEHKRWRAITLAGIAQSKAPASTVSRAHAAALYLLDLFSVSPYRASVAGWRALVPPPPSSLRFPPAGTPEQEADRLLRANQPQRLSSERAKAWRLSGWRVLFLREAHLGLTFALAPGNPLRSARSASATIAAYRATAKGKPSASR